jgi:hypothetical protein
LVFSSAVLLTIDQHIFNDYFAYFILIRWIKDQEVLGYYERQLTNLIKNMTAKYGIFDQRSSWRAWYPYLDELIDKWKIGVPD